VFLYELLVGKLKNCFCIMFALVLMSQFSSLIVQTASIKVIYGYEVTSQTCDNLIHNQSSIFLF